ncbi:MAG TPA: ROK family protein [Chthoniobacterales bacterium]|nr:ROK family protein [Chthoniobacterales bacterium]
MKKAILVVDIGGTHVKLMISPTETRKFDSGMKLSPRELVSQIKKNCRDWKYDAVSIGFPSVVRQGQIRKDPKHLAPGWVGWNFNKSLGKPTRVMNDAAMQALGSYRSGRMLFLGLGTGLGSALVWNNNLLPLELGDLPYEGGIIEQVLGKPGLERLGKKKWKREVLFCLKNLKLSFIVDYIVLGGGNARQFDTLPDGIVPGDNRNVYLGGLRMWETEPRTRRAKWKVL